MSVRLTVTVFRFPKLLIAVNVTMTVVVAGGFATMVNLQSSFPSNPFNTIDPVGAADASSDIPMSHTIERIILY